MDKNRLIMEFGCDARNEAVARVVVAAMLTRTNPTLSEVEDVKTAVSEAVTNSIIHGYGSGEGSIILEAYIEERTLYITITDHGCGIENVDRAMEPLYTTVTDGRCVRTVLRSMRIRRPDVMMHSQYAATIVVRKCI